ncbi:MAG: CARDB domain-containing protein [Tepidisphaeraceae bacterium]
MDILATGRSTTYTDFTRLKFRSLGSSGGSGPVFDNIQTNVANVSIAALDGDAGESPTNPGTFRITRAGGNLATALPVSFLVYGSATNGTDYTAIPLSATIPQNQTYVDVTITPTSDADLEGDENVVLKLSELPGYQVSNTGRTAEVLIKDYMADLVVTNVIMSNPRPVEGETITFQVTVTNVGNAPVPANLGWQAGILFDVQGQNSFLTPAQNTSLGAGLSTTLNVTGSYTYTARAGKHQITAWVDPALPNWNSTTGRVPESNDRNNAFVSMFNVASSRWTDSATSLSNWSTVDAGWVVKTTGTQTYFENTANTSSTRRLQRNLTTSTDHSWTLDFGHNWQWGGTSGYGQHSLSLSADVLDDTNSGFRVRFYQGSGGNSAYDGELVKIFKVNNGVEAQQPLDTGIGFDSPGWRSLNANGVPTWRRSRLMYDVGTRTLTVLLDLTGTGTYTAVAHAADLAAPRTFTKLGFNAENLINAVAPELDDIQFDTLY